MQQHTISQLNCDLWRKVGFIRQLAMTSSVTGSRRSSKALTKSKLAPVIKGPDHCLVVYCCPSDSLQLSESWWNQYIWEVWSANWWNALKTGTPAASYWTTERAQFFTTPNWCHTTDTSKAEWIWLRSFVSSVISSPTNYHFKQLDNFMQGKPFRNQQEAENAFQEFIEFRSTNFYATGINKLISYCLKCIDCIGSYFD